MSAQTDPKAQAREDFAALSVVTRVDLLARGEATLSRWGTIIPTRITAASRVRLFAAIRKGYLLSRASEKPLRTLWCFYCDKAPALDVLATIRNRYAKVRLDMITCDRRLPKTATDLLKAEFGAFGGHVADGYVYFDRVPVAEAERVAMRLHEIGTSTEGEGT